MPLTNTLKILSPDGSLLEEVQFSLPDEAVATLEAFLTYVDALDALSIVRSPPPLSLRLHFESGVLEFSGDLPDWESVMPLLHRLRPVVLEREHASFAVVSSILGREIQSPAFRSMLKFARQVYDGRQQQSLYQLATDGTILNSERVLMDWLNAYEYHRDQALKASVDALLSQLPAFVPRFVFASLLFEKLHAAQSLAGMVELALGRRGQFHATVPSHP